MYNTLFKVKKNPAVSYLVLEYIVNHFFPYEKKKKHCIKFTKINVEKANE